MVDKELTPKQEKFCQVYIETSNASEAYRQAYNCENMQIDTIHTAACKVLGNYKVALRIKELQEEHKQRHMVTVDSLTKELEELKFFAMDKEQAAAAISAVMGKAKIHGFDKSTIKLDIPKVIRKDLTGKKE